MADIIDKIMGLFGVVLDWFTMCWEKHYLLYAAIGLFLIIVFMIISKGFLTPVSFP